MVSETREVEALTLLCSYLGELHERAELGLWSRRLDRLVSRVRDGGSAVEACARLGVTIAEDGAAVRAPGSGPWRIPGLRVPDLPVGKGRFTCPHGICRRSGQRDADGHPPFCTLFERPMQPQ